MSDDAKAGGDAAKDRRKARSQRASAVIESTAVDITPEVVQTTAEEMTNAPAVDALSQAAETVTHAEDRQTGVLPEEPELQGPKAVEPEVKAAEAIAPEPAPEPPAADPVIAAMPPPPPPRSLAGPMAAAAVIGGLLGTAGGAVVPGILGMGKAPDPAAEIARLRQQVAALESRPAAAAGVPVNFEPLNQRIAAIEAEAQKRVADAEKRQADRIAALEVAVRAAAARPATPGQPAPPPLDLTPLTSRLQSIEDSLKTVDGKAEAAARAAEPQIAALAGSLQETARKTEAVTPALAALTAKIEQATQKVDAGAAGPLFAATQGLVQAFNRGQSFTVEIAAVEALGGDGALLASLKPLAEKGAPTAEALAKAFAPLAHATAIAGLPPEEGAMGFVKRFIKIRPTGEAGGDSQPSLVATVEAALAKGQTGAALATWRRLPEVARNASSTWAASVEAREKAAAALKQLQDGVLAKLRTAKP